MLVLTRKVDQSIMIGDHIRVVVVDVRGDQVKLGIDAPRGCYGASAGDLSGNSGRESTGGPKKAG